MQSVLFVSGGAAAAKSAVSTAAASANSDVAHPHHVCSQGESCTNVVDRSVLVRLNKKAIQRDWSKMFALEPLALRAERCENDGAKNVASCFGLGLSLAGMIA